MSAGNAFTNPSAAKIDQQRKILEELERQKKLFKAGGSQSQQGQNSAAAAATAAAAAVSSPSHPASSTGAAPSQSLSSSSSATLNPANVEMNVQLTSNQRAALEVASKTSFGYFITQDSSFGNLILPVIPRF